MFGVISISIVALLLIATTVITLIIVYKAYYTNQINKKIQSGQITGKPMKGVPNVVRNFAFVGVIFYAIIITCVAENYAIADHSIGRNGYAVVEITGEDAYKTIQYSGNGVEGDASFTRMYSKEENLGYDKRVEDFENYRFTIFTRNSKSDYFHPDFLCFVEYTGTEPGKYMLYSREGFQAIDPDGNSIFVGSGGDIGPDLLYIGNLDEEYEFIISMSLLDEAAEMKYDEAYQKAFEEDKGNFPLEEEFAVSGAKVSIIID